MCDGPMQADSICAVLHRP